MFHFRSHFFLELRVIQLGEPNAFAPSNCDAQAAQELLPVPSETLENGMSRAVTCERTRNPNNQVA